MLNVSLKTGCKKNQIFSFCPNPCNNIETISAILCLVLPEISALKAVSSFLVHFITRSRETSQAEVVQNYGESLVLRILMNLGK